MSKNYAVSVTREGKWWMVHVPDIDGLTQARRLDETAAMATSLIAVTLGIPAAAVHITVTVDLPDSVTTHIGRAAALRATAAQAQGDAAKEIRAAATELKSAGLPLRDIGEVLGVSYQRAHQLVTAA